MRTIKIILALFFYSSFIISAGAQETETPMQQASHFLQLNLPDSQSYKFVIQQHQQIEQSMLERKTESTIAQTLEIRLNTLARSEEFQQAELSFDRISVSLQSPGGNLELDTQSPDGQPETAYLDSLLSRSFILHFNHSGEIVNLDSLQAEAARHPGPDSSEPALAEFLNTPALLNTVASIFNVFPADSLNIGESWNRQISGSHTQKYTLEGLSEDLAWVTIDEPQNRLPEAVGQLSKLNSSQDGTIEIDLETGMIYYSERNTHFQGTLDGQGIPIMIQLHKKEEISGQRL